MLVDTHCHLQLLGDDRAAVLAAAHEGGVGWIVDVGIDLDSSERAAAGATAAVGATAPAVGATAPAGAIASDAGLPSAGAGPPSTGVSATVGIHPNDAAELTPAVLLRLRELAAQPGVVGVGETGLDYYRLGAPAGVQRAAFAAHIELARAFDLALVVHCRDAFDDVLAVLADSDRPERVVLHCFTGGPEMAERAVAAGCFVSFSGTVTFRNAPAQRDACRRVPVARLLVETDAPFLTPHPFRGQPNRPEKVAVTAQTVGELHGLSLEEITAITAENARRAFALRLTTGDP